MYYIVEFLEEGTVGVVPNTWVTSRESCRWPPSSVEWTTKLKKLIRLKSPPDDCFGTYKIRILGSSDTLERANEKAKKADYTSELNTTDCEDVRIGRPKRKIVKRKAFSSSDEESDSNFNENSKVLKSISPPSPPPLPISTIPNSSLQNLPSSSKQFFPLHLPQQNKENRPTNYHPSSQQFPPSSQQFPPSPQQFSPSSPSLFTHQLGRPPAIEEVDTSGFSIQALLQLNSEFHRQILRKLKLIETELARQRELLQQQLNPAVNIIQQLPNLPFSLPITSGDELTAVEDYLNLQSNQDVMIRHLKLVGGAKLDIAVRGILSRCMTNGMASMYSYNGLRDKESFKSLKLKEVVFSAVQLLYPEVTEAEFSKISGDWFRYAPRKKGGNKENKTEPGMDLDKEKEIDGIF